MKYSLGLAAALSATASALPSAIDSRAYSPVPAARVLLGHTGNIYIADYISDTGKFEISLNETANGDPSYMVYAAPDRLYAVDEWSAAIYHYGIDLSKNKLELKGGENGSVGVVHLEFNKYKNRLVGSAYGNGTIDVWDISNGGLRLMKTIKSDDALGPNKLRQDAPHPHQANLDPSGRYFAVNDLGTDSILLIDSKEDAFVKRKSIRVEPAGCGPRHGVWYPQGADKATHYMVVCEMLNKVLVYSVEYTYNTIAFTQTQTLSSYGDLAPANATSAAAGEIVLSPYNDDLYISNRVSGNKTDSIAHFKVNKSDCGKVTLKYSDTVSSGGLLPRMISVSDKGSVVFSANQDGQYGLAALKVGANGKLHEKPVASLDNSIFGEQGFGPQFVKQIA
ncbi:Lactonase, 7-bladed beta-propeller-domain-containing protein [Thelonectria olida]|uniref:Lactonase, 7-bladed beta-propeller-domain-containing protein n=1 Tax=Thelonectria olida TaxID=1576542 RepID=A0A9P9AR38_9HYPO|nr:Lactonase, 7-bladed beta-propeller-domain-containing protein [Thelonectria olida]